MILNSKIRGPYILNCGTRDNKVTLSSRPSDLCIAYCYFTSTETMWCLFALSQVPEVQSRLRAELLTVQTDTPSSDELNALPFLDAVVRETLRLHAAVPNTIRIAMHDDVLPLSKPIVARHGVTREEIQ